MSCNNSINTLVRASNYTASSLCLGGSLHTYHLDQSHFLSNVTIFYGDWSDHATCKKMHKKTTLPTILHKYFLRP